MPKSDALRGTLLLQHTIVVSVKILVSAQAFPVHEVIVSYGTKPWAASS